KGKGLVPLKWFAEENTGEETRPMSSVPPSERVAKEIDALLSVEERSEGANLASELMRLGLQRLVQEALEQEVARYLVPPEKVVDLEVSWIGHGSGDPIG